MLHNQGAGFDSVLSIEELLAHRQPPLRTTLIDFSDRTDEHYVTNPSAARKFGNHALFAARHELVADELSSEIHFYYAGRNPAVRYGDVSRTGQDPFLPSDTFLFNGQEHRFFGYVAVERDDKDATVVKDYRTVLEAAPRQAMPEAFERIFVGPEKTKGVRPVRMLASASNRSSRRTAVYSRPHLAGGFGRVTCLPDVHDVADLKIDDIVAAPVVEGLCGEEEWVGVNDCHPIDDRRVRLFYHRARYESEPDAENPDRERVKGYYSMTGVHDTWNGTVSDQQILATPDDFTGYKPRRDTLHVTYPGGAEVLNRRRGLYALQLGLGDTAAGWCVNRIAS